MEQVWRIPLSHIRSRWAPMVEYSTPAVRYKHNYQELILGHVSEA